MIKVLDCTLRDGGYVNNWNFGFENIQQIISNLSKAGIEYIECGFFKNINYNKDKSLYSNLEQLNLFNKNLQNKFTLMINYGEIDIDSIPPSKNQNIIFRIAFKKHNKKEALCFCKQLIQEKNYKIFINPMYINTYSEKELIALIQEINELQPLGFSIVDTTGAMREADIQSLYKNIENQLNESIALCFHSHNNLQLSFSNAKFLINICKDRELIIDSTVFGIGRGAGNLCTELITQYLNDFHNTQYQIEYILNIIENQINQIFTENPWGYSTPYYLTAINNCHPSYGKFLLDNNITSFENINKILTKIPIQNKSNYNEDIIKNLTIKYLP